METGAGLSGIFDTYEWLKSEFRHYYFTTTFNGCLLNGCLEFTPEELQQFDRFRMKRIAGLLSRLDVNAKKFIETTLSATGTGGLTLSTLSVYPDYSCALGYSMGKSAAGNLYMYVKFNSDFSLQEELILENY